MPATPTPGPTIRTPTRRGIYSLTQQSVNTRLTWQANAKNKFSGFYDNQWRCWCVRQLPTTSPESASTYDFPIENLAALNWSSPLTSRLLIEASVVAPRRALRGATSRRRATSSETLIPVTEQSTGLLYRGIGTAVATQPFIANTTSPSNAQALADVRDRHARPEGRLQRHLGRPPRHLRFARRGRADLSVQHGQRRHHAKPDHRIRDAVQQQREPRRRTSASTRRTSGR